MLALQNRRRNRKTSLSAICAAMAMTMACSGGSSDTTSPSPISSGGGTSGSGTCRTFTTAADVTTVSGGVTTNAKVTGAFNSSTNQSTSNTLFANGNACSTTIGSYRSTADFVDEVRVVPGVFLLTSSTTTNAVACGTGSGTTTYTYDAQRRLTQTANSGGTTTWTQWDNSGRPTLGSSPGATYVISYDDSARASTTTTTTSNGTSVGILTYDANGNQLRNEVRGSSGTSVTTYSINSTDKVCK